MRVALAGKGGVGKTTISATLSRLAARAGADVVAVDADSNPNLAPALGMPRTAFLPVLPQTMVSRRPTGPALTVAVTDVLAAHTVPAPDGVRLVTMGAPGHADEGCLCGAHAVVSALLDDLGAGSWVVVMDLEASPEHLSRGTARHADVMILVTEPYYRALETTRRLALLAAELPITRTGVVVNKVRSDDDALAVAQFCGRHDLEQLAVVPWSDDVLVADRQGRSLLDVAPASPAVAAIAALADTLGLTAPSAIGRN